MLSSLKAVESESVVRLLHTSSQFSATKDDDIYPGKPKTYATSAISLPYELLQDIFRLVYPRKGIHNAPTPPEFLVLGQVCGHWRKALIADMYMWSRISLPSYVPDLVNQCLSYSKDRPLEIYIGDFHPLLEDVFSQMYRIKSLFLENLPVEKYCRTYLSRPAPCLEILCMSGPGHNTTSGLMKSLFQHQTPIVKHLHLRGTTTFPFEFMFHTLIHLNLQNSPDFPPFDRLFDILELSPNLQEFIFHSTARYDNDTSLEDIPEDRCVKIPLLSQIELRAPSSIILLLIRHIVIPDGTKWSLKCPDLDIMLDRTFLSFLSRHSVGRSRLHCLVIGKILYINLYEYYGDTEKKMGKLNLQIHSPDIFLSLRTLFGSEALSRVTLLELDYTSLILIKNFYHSILWHFPNVWSLTVNATLQSTSTQNINYFSDALSTRTGDGFLPCPSLTHLVICARMNTTAAFEALVSCLRHRHALQSPVQSLKIVDEALQNFGEYMERITQYVSDVQITKKEDDSWGE